MKIDIPTTPHPNPLHLHRALDSDPEKATTDGSRRAGEPRRHEAFYEELAVRVQPAADFSGKH